MRCENRFKVTPINLERVVGRLRFIIAEYLAARKPIDKFIGETLQKKRCEMIPDKWSAPKEDVIKVNCDAFVDIEGKITGVGVIARDHVGQVAGDVAKCLKVDVVEVAKAIVIREGIDLALNRGWRFVEVETDNKIVFTSILESNADGRSKLQGIVKDIQEKLQSMELAQVVLISRKANRRADWVAKAN